jgi:hypothetical protein
VVFLVCLQRRVQAVHRGDPASGTGPWRDQDYADGSFRSDRVHDLGVLDFLKASQPRPGRPGQAGVHLQPRGRQAELIIKQHQVPTDIGDQRARRLRRGTGELHQHHGLAAAVGTPIQQRLETVGDPHLLRGQAGRRVLVPAVSDIRWLSAGQTPARANFPCPSCTRQPGQASLPRPRPWLPVAGVAHWP